MGAALGMPTRLLKPRSSAISAKSAAGLKLARRLRLGSRSQERRVDVANAVFPRRSEVTLSSAASGAVASDARGMGDAQPTSRAMGKRMIAVDFIRNFDMPEEVFNVWVSIFSLESSGSRQSIEN